jgi:inhibitor of KinA
MNPPRIYAIHDQALTIEFADSISESIHARVIALQKKLEADPIPGLIEIVPSYSSLTVYFDPGPIPVLNKNTTVKAWLLQHAEKTGHAVDLSLDSSNDSNNGNHPKKDHGPIEKQGNSIVEIPVCYDATLGFDLHWVARQLGMLPEEVVRLHASASYRVYMIGFIPGFAYMGTLPEALEVPRKKTPVSSVPAGSVALAGRQTGIYPAAIAGGWQVIGRTPLKLFDKKRNPVCLLKAGDLVRFTSISKEAFDQFT